MPTDSAPACATNARARSNAASSRSPVIRTVQLSPRWIAVNARLAPPVSNHSSSPARAIGPSNLFTAPGQTSIPCNADQSLSGRRSDRSKKGPSPITRTRSTCGSRAGLDQASKRCSIKFFVTQELSGEPERWTWFVGGTQAAEDGAKTFMLLTQTRPATTARLRFPTSLADLPAGRSGAACSPVCAR